MGALVQGSVGALLSLVGLFMVFYLTRQHEIKRDQRRAEFEDHVRRDERTRRNVSAVIREAHAVRAYEQNSESRARDLAQALMLFSVEEGGDYPHASQWAYQKSGDVLRCLRIGQDPRALVWECGHISSNLGTWMSEGCPDSLRARPDDGEDKPSKAEGLEDALMNAFIEILREKRLPPTLENMRSIIDESKREFDQGEGKRTSQAE